MIKHIGIYGLFFMSLGSLGACKNIKRLQDSDDKQRKLSTDDRGDSDQLDQSADKESESVTGIPGYQLSCLLQTIPSSIETDATTQCKVHGLTVNHQVDWIADRPDESNPLQVRLNGDQDFVFKVNGSTREMTLDLLLRTLITATIQGRPPLKKLGRELLTADPNTYRVNSRCDQLFAFMLSNDQNQFLSVELTKFAGCDTLAAALNQKSVSNQGEVVPLPAGPTVSASCASNQLTINVTQAEFQGSSSVGPVRQPGCQKLVNLIHDVKL